MSTAHQEKVDTKQLEALIHSAIKKIQGKKENDICRYLPVDTGGYIHHFTMRKMKTEAPSALQALISKYILNSDKPTTVRPKQRAPRGSRKRRDQVVLSKSDVESMLTLARRAGAHDMVRKLTPKRDTRTLKKELISAIKQGLHGAIEQELWNSYVEAMSTNYAQIA
jgi:hypothetical protein